MAFDQPGAETDDGEKPFHPPIAAETSCKIKPICPEFVLRNRRRRQIIAVTALVRLAEMEEVRSPRWRCSRCGQVKRFTRAVPKETADRCPKCRGIDFGVEP